LAAILLPALSRARESARRSSCANNLKQMGLVLKMYSNESRGQKFPTNHNSADHVGIDWIFPIQIPSGPAIYPEYLTDVNIFFCPSASQYNMMGLSTTDQMTDCSIGSDGTPRGIWCQGKAWDDWGIPDDRAPAGLDPGKFFSGGGYEYSGWAGAENVETWITWQAWRGQILLGGGLGSGSLDANVIAAFDQDAETGDIDMPGWISDISDLYPTSSFTSGFQSYVYPTEAYGNGNSIGGSIYRLREGIERFMITDINNPAGSAMAQSALPVMWDMSHLDFGGFSGPGTFNHVPAGANVLFMDGHVKFYKYPSAEIGPLHPGGVGQMT
jgi:prepilin-type processing-associated H-X9-DG protein